MKAALIRYAQGLAYRLAPKMIRVNAVLPGNVYFEGGIWQWIEENNNELFKQAMALNPTGDCGRVRPRHRVSRQPGVELHRRHQPCDRWCAYQRCAALV